MGEDNEDQIEGQGRRWPGYGRFVSKPLTRRPFFISGSSLCSQQQHRHLLLTFTDSGVPARARMCHADRACKAASGVVRRLERLLQS
jgi:hypothetical protein